MLGTALRHLLRHPLAVVSDLAADPLQVLTTLRDAYVAEREYCRPQYSYSADASWERKLHENLGLPWPCPVTAEFRALWPEVMRELQNKGVQPGPESFKYWNDGDAGFVRTIWCVTRHVKASRVIETGVAHGVTSRFVLEALERNGDGHLWSIDLPPMEPEWRKQVGIATDGRYSDRWSYINGSSRRRLPSLLSRVGPIDVFIHDSLHTERNVRFELDQAWEAVRPGGALIVDDVDSNCGFQSFRETFTGHRSFVCEAEPIRPDLRRFNQKGLFGIILKEPATQLVSQTASA